MKFTLEQTLADTENVDGWLRVSQAGLLWESAARVPQGGLIVEIGSYRGCSTIFLARAAGDEVRVIAIDPHGGDDRSPGEWTGTSDEGEADHVQFMINLRAAAVADRVEHVREYSHDAHPLVDGSIDLLYVDGAHGYGPAVADIAGWGGRVAPGGSMLIHDTYNSLFVTLAVMRRLWFDRRWIYVGRAHSMVHYRREDLTRKQRVANIAHQLGCLPYFARNMAIRALRAAGVERFARILGHVPGSGTY